MLSVTRSSPLYAECCAPPLVVMLPCPSFTGFPKAAEIQLFVGKG